MKKNILMLLCLGILLAVPNLAVSDCTDFGRVTSWHVQDEHTIIFYSQVKPLAKITLKDCSVLSSSNIRFLETYMCDGEKLIIDGEECYITRLESASGASF
jgi:hypothetical protein